MSCMEQVTDLATGNQEESRRKKRIMAIEMDITSEGQGD